MVGSVAECSCCKSCCALSCLIGSLRSTEYSNTLVSTAFMQLITTQSIAAGVETGRAPQMLKRDPGFVGPSRFIGVHGFHHKAHPSAVRQGGSLVRFEDALFECRCKHLNHICTACWSCPCASYSR